MVPQILDEATKARAKSIQLKGMDFAAELSSQLMKHGSEMESFYSSFKAAIEKPSPDRDEIKKLVKAIKVKRAWFEKAEVRYYKTSMFHRVKLLQWLVETKTKSMLVALFDSTISCCYKFVGDWKNMCQSSKSDLLFWDAIPHLPEASASGMIRGGGGKAKAKAKAKGKSKAEKASS